MSSSAQLTLLPWLLGWPARDTTFTAGLHAGSSLGLAVALRSDLKDRRTRRHIVLSSIPAALAGLLAQDVVERRLGRPGPTAALLAGTGALLWLADTRPEEADLTTRHVAVASVAQVLALAPGVSRSGAVLTVLRAMRVPRAEAARLSLLMSLPVTFGAGALTAVRSGRLPRLWPAALAAAGAVATQKAVERASFRVLPATALYRLALAAAVGARLRSTKGIT